jgi:homoisocitrate dehydrogenase
VVVRENTEDLYLGRERTEDNGDTAIAERVITRRASERIARAAFELARSRGSGIGDRGSEEPSDNTTRSPTPGPRPLVTIVHKANVMRETCGLFRAAALQVAQDYPDVAADELLVDNAALQLVQRPERFDVIVTTNMFGDILSDIASYWAGGLGMACSANLGEQQALFEPVHGSAPDIAGKGIANPLAAIGCAAMMLDYFARRPTTYGRDISRPDQPTTNETYGRDISRPDQPTTNDQQEVAAQQFDCATWAARIRMAIDTTLANGPRTPDLGGSATTEAVTGAVLEALANA